MASEKLTDENPVVAPSGRAPSARFLAKREAIVLSAVAQINRHGVRGMTLGDVAACLNLVPSGLIYYFKSKEDLAVAVFLKAIARFNQLIADSENAPDAPARLRAFILNYFDYRAQVAKGLAEPIANFNDIKALDRPEVNDAYIEMFRRARRLIPVSSVATRGDRNGRTVLLLATLTFSTAWLFYWRPADYARIADRMANVLMNGIVTKDSRLPHPQDLVIPDGGYTYEEGSPEQFLRAATQLINEEGYHGASADRISAQLNVTKGAFYHYNSNKDELVVAGCHRTFAILWRAIDAAEATVVPADGKLRVFVTLLSTLIRLQQSSAPLLRTTALSTVPENIRIELLVRLRGITIRYASMLCDGVSDGSIRPIDTTLTAQIITAAINSASELAWWHPDDGADVRAKYYVDALLRGLLHS